MFNVIRYAESYQETGRQATTDVSLEKPASDAPTVDPSIADACTNGAGRPADAVSAVRVESVHDRTQHHPMWVRVHVVPWPGIEVQTLFLDRLTGHLASEAPPPPAAIKGGVFQSANLHSCLNLSRFFIQLNNHFEHLID